MDRYIGVDAHARTCTLGVVGQSGKRLNSMVVETNGRALVDALRTIPRRRHVCLEEGTQSAWLYELFEPHSDEIVVTVPEQTKGSKSDKRDAFTRAEEMRVGAIRTVVYKAPVFLAALRNAVRNHRFAVQDTVRAKNRLKAVFRSRGVTTDGTIYVPSRRTGWLKKLPPVHRELARRLAQQLDAVEPLRQEAEAWLLKEAKTHPIIRKLSTAPGMGPIRTAQLVAIVADPFRFRTRQQFWSYSGLGIVTRSSSDWVPAKGGGWVKGETCQARGLSRKRNPLLKAVFKGAATTVITQLHDNQLYADYQRTIGAGTKPNLAKLTLARRIAAIVLSMWKHREVYDPTRR
jgi:transposase